MKYQVFEKCPVCSSKMYIQSLHCDRCNTTINGKFEFNKFSKLGKEQLHFAEIFIKNRGNIKEIEKELGVSYPTVRKYLDSIIEELGYSVEKETNQVNKKEVLEKLEKGEISSEEALEMLKK